MILADGFLSQRVRDWAIIAEGCGCLLVLVLAACGLALLISNRRIITRYITVTEHALEMVGEYSKMFRDTGSDLPDKIKDATKEVIKEVRKENIARESVL